MSYAVDEDWIDRDPFRGIKVALLKAQISLWSQHDVDRWIEAAHAVDLSSIAPPSKYGQNLKGNQYVEVVPRGGTAFLCHQCSGCVTELINTS